MTDDTQISKTGSHTSSRVTATLVIVCASLLVAAISYSIQQYNIRQDMSAGELKRQTDQQNQSQNADESEQERRYVEAQRHLSEVLSDSLKKNPNDSSIYLPLGSARIAIGDTVGALQIYESYVKNINPANLAAQTDYGYLLFSVGRTDEGRELTLKVLKKQPKNQIALYNLAAMSYKQTHLADAINWMQRCVDADSSSQIASMARMALDHLQTEQKKATP